MLVEVRGRNESCKNLTARTISARKQCAIRLPMIQAREPMARLSQVLVLAESLLIIFDQDFKRKERPLEGHKILVAQSMAA